MLDMGFIPQVRRDHPPDSAEGTADPAVLGDLHRRRAAPGQAVRRTSPAIVEIEPEQRGQRRRRTACLRGGRQRQVQAAVQPDASRTTGSRCWSSPNRKGVDATGRRAWPRAASVPSDLRRQAAAERGKVLERFKAGEVARAGGHRRGGARVGHPRPAARWSTSTCRSSPRTTCTASAAPAAPAPRARRCRWSAPTRWSCWRPSSRLHKLLPRHDEPDFVPRPPGAADHHRRSGARRSRRNPRSPSRAARRRARRWAAGWTAARRRSRRCARCRSSPPARRARARQAGRGAASGSPPRASAAAAGGALTSRRARPGASRDCPGGPNPRANPPGAAATIARLTDPQECPGVRRLRRRL